MRGGTHFRDRARFNLPWGSSGFRRRELGRHVDRAAQHKRTLGLRWKNSRANATLDASFALGHAHGAQRRPVNWPL